MCTYVVQMDKKERKVCSYTPRLRLSFHSKNMDKMTSWVCVYLQLSNFIFLSKNYYRFLILKPTRCTNFSNLFLERKFTCFGQCLCPSSGVSHCTHNNGICHKGLMTAFSGWNPDTARKLSANLYDIHHCCVYSEKFLMMEGGTARNM